MPNRANNSRENRYAILASGPPPKVKKSKGSPFSFFPDLPQVNVPNPKYVIISSNEVDKTMADYSCFAVYKSIQLISKEIISISELRDGNLLLLAKDGKIAAKFVSSTSLLGVCRIKCKLHEQLNTTKGTVFAPYLNKISDDEIVKELHSQGVTAAFKFNKIVEGKPQPSGVVLLSFDSYTLPSKIDISWHSVKVKEYFPNPMRCKNCQLLGHTAKWCKNATACVNCSLPPHAPEVCTRTFCANCSENHPASSSDCTKFKQQKEILIIKTKNKCTMQQAKQLYRTNIPPPHSNDATSYARVVSQLPNETVSQKDTITTNISLPLPNNPASNNRNQSLTLPPISLSTADKINHNPTTNPIKNKNNDNFHIEHSNASESISATNLLTNTSNLNNTSLSLYSPPRTRKSAKKQPTLSRSNSSLDLPLKETDNTRFNLNPPTSLLIDDESIADKDEVL